MGRRNLRIAHSWQLGTHSRGQRTAASHTVGAGNGRSRQAGDSHAVNFGTVLGQRPLGRSFEERWDGCRVPATTGIDASTGGRHWQRGSANGHGICADGAALAKASVVPLLSCRPVTVGLAQPAQQAHRQVVTPARSPLTRQASSCTSDSPDDTVPNEGDRRNRSVANRGTSK